MRSIVTPPADDDDDDGAAYAGDDVPDPNHNMAETHTNARARRILVASLEKRCTEVRFAVLDRNRFHRGNLFWISSSNPRLA